MNYSRDLSGPATHILRQNYLVTAAIVVAICVVYRSIYRKFLHLQHIPGPWWACYTRLWLLRTLASNDPLSIYIDTNLKYGPLARIGPNHLLTSDPEVFRSLLAARTDYKRGRWFDTLKLDPKRANLLSEKEWPRHNNIRQQLAPSFDGKNFTNFEEVMNENLQQWLSYVDKNAVTKIGHSVKEFDIGRSVAYLTTDMISRLSFGQPLGFIESHEDQHKLFTTLEERLPYVEKFSLYTEMCTLLWMVAYIPWLKKILPSADDHESIGRIMGIARDEISERVAQEKFGNDMLGSFLKNGLSAEDAQNEIMVGLFVGSDTTSTSIRAILLHVISNPLVYTRLVQEIEAAIARGLISNPAREEELRKLPYLQACIREGLRVFPPLTYLRERVVPPQGDYLCGFHIPGRTNIGLNLPGLLLNPVFGLDARTFRPERWLDQEPGNLKEMERVMDLVWGGGSTRCLGIRIANASQSKFFLEVFRRWDIVLTRPITPWNSRCHGVFFQKDFFVSLTPKAGRCGALEDQEKF